MRLFLTLLVMALAPDTIRAQPAMDAFVSEMREECRVSHQGELMIGEGAISSVDLTGDGHLDVVVDSQYLRCSTLDAPPYCGTGGCAVFAHVGNTVYEWQAHDWRVIPWDDEPILILMRDGGWCGVSSAGYCFEALNWNGSAFLTVMAPPD